MEIQILTGHFRRHSAGLSLVACVLALGLASPAWAASARAATPLPVTAGSDYLALGDSVAFGYQDGSKQNPNDINQFVGYPEVIGRQLHLSVANASCSGETSSSMINASAPSDGCENGIAGVPGGYRSEYPLHVRYAGSQLSYAVSYLKAHKNVRLVSLQIGSADLSLCQRDTTDECSSPSEIEALDAKLQANVRTILSTIRGKARYAGQLAVVNYYATDYDASLENTLTSSIDGVLDDTARPYDVRLVNTYTAFRAASASVSENPCAAGLIDVIAPGICGYHPTPAGQTLIADTLRKAIVVGKPA